MVVTAPLTIKSTRSMLAMQRIQPEVKKLQELHKGDKVKQNEEMMALYKRHGVNPLSSCLPLFLQFPLTLTLFHLARGITKTKTVEGVVRATPKFLNHTSRLYKDLVADGGRMHVFGMNLGESPSDARSRGTMTTLLPFLVLLVCYAGFTWYSQRQIMSRRKKQAPGEAAPKDAMSQMNTTMQYILPVMMIVIGWRFPAAVLLNWSTQTLFRIALQGAMWKYDPALKEEVASIHEEVEALVQESKKAPTKSNGRVTPSKKSKKR